MRLVVVDAVGAVASEAVEAVSDAGVLGAGGDLAWRFLAASSLGSG